MMNSMMRMNLPRRGLPTLLCLAGALVWSARLPSASAAIPATPTPDRLAAPPTVESPTQADVGAQVYWLNCQPCHGDQGQGLTDEWRAQYPPEDQNCWNSGCHGERPYESGFKLPQHVPAVIGPGTLTRFATAADLYAFISRAMPFQAPGSLKPDEYWAVTAFLVRAQGRGDPAQVLSSEAAARQIVIHTPVPTLEATPVVLDRIGSDDFNHPYGYAIGGLALIGVAALLLWSVRRSRQ